MDDLSQLITEQLMDYTKELKIAEAELVRKIKAGEDYSAEGKRAVGLKALQEECIKMLAKERVKNQR